MNNSYLHVINLLISGASDNIICLSAWFLNNKCLTHPFIRKYLSCSFLDRFRAICRHNTQSCFCGSYNHNPQLGHDMTQVSTELARLNSVTPLTSGSQICWPVIHFVPKASLPETEKTSKEGKVSISTKSNSKTCPPLKHNSLPMSPTPCSSSAHHLHSPSLQTYNCEPWSTFLPQKAPWQGLASLLSLGPGKMAFPPLELQPPLTQFAQVWELP